MSYQWSAEMEPVGRLDHLRASNGWWSDDDVYRDRVDLGVVVDIDAGEEVAPSRDAGLVLAEPSGGGADESEGEVITEVDGDQLGQSPPVMAGTPLP